MGILMTLRHRDYKQTKKFELIYYRCHSRIIKYRDNFGGT